jgi:hypothetical protein
MYIYNFVLKIVNIIANYCDKSIANQATKLLQTKKCVQT